MDEKLQSNATKILITGATGLVGKKLVDLLLSKGYCVHYLSTSKQKLQQNDTVKGFYWNIKTNEIDSEAFTNVSVIFHLAGSSIAKRWTKKYKQEIIESRVLSIQLLHKTLASIEHRVTHFISASAIGIYSSSFSKNYTENDSEIDNSFLGEVVKKWETEVDTLSSLNISVAKVRIGLVLSREGGALTEMVKPVKFGLGSALGNGKQFQSWIHIDDLVGIFYFVLKNNLSGTFNAVSSNPVTNTELTRAIAKTIQKPFFMPNVPGFVLKLILGEMSYLLLSSQKVSNEKIISNGFLFQFDDLDKALEDCLK